MIDSVWEDMNDDGHVMFSWLPVAGRSRQRPWVSCVCSASRFDAIEARGWEDFSGFFTADRMQTLAV